MRRFPSYTRLAFVANALQFVFLDARSPSGSGVALEASYPGAVLVLPPLGSDVAPECQPTFSTTLAPVRISDLVANPVAGASSTGCHVVLNVRLDGICFFETGREGKAGRRRRLLALQVAVGAPDYRGADGQRGGDGCSRGRRGHVVVAAMFVDCLGGWRGLQAQQALALGPVAGGGQQGEHRLPDVRGEGGQGSDGEVASHGRGLSCSGFPKTRGVLTMLVGCW